jgi:transcriptional regulator with PAS, ATPase and Fis domain
MSRIGLILPYEKINNEEFNAFKDLKDVEVKIGILNEAFNAATELINNGAEVLVCRGGTVDYLKKHFKSIPIIDIEISSYDIAEAINKAKKFDDNLAFIVFRKMLFEDKKLPLVFDFNIKIYFIENESEVRGAILKAKEDGYSTFLGGRTVSRICAELSYRSLLLSSGTDSILTAIRQAQQVLKAKDESIRNISLIKDVIENTRIGFIAINEDNQVKLANRKAIEFINKSNEQIIGSNIYNLLSMDYELEDGNSVIELNGKNILINKKSRYIESIDIASVLTLEKSSDINEKERNLRELFAQKGYNAKYTFEDIRGKSKSIKETIDLSKRYALSDSTILIVGETGTGKEMFAQSIHNFSPRQKGPFVAINCAALTESLLESELFGYVKGAFTGASTQGKAGIFEMANGGTIFLDEISEVSLTTQAKLLRVIQERKVMRIGDTNIMSVDVRIIVATNKSLLELIDQGRFRSDLYYRLSVLNITLPPLRDRIADISLLMNDFFNYYSISLQKDIPMIGEKCFEILKSYDWPGNIRELKNFVESLMVAFDEKVITTEMLYKILKIEKTSGKAFDDIQPEDVMTALRNNNNNKTKAAKELGISRTSLWKILKYNNIQRTI